MIADVFHSSLNPRGGSERVAIATIRALLGIDGIDVRLNTFEQPNLTKLTASYGQNVTAMMQRISRIGVYQSLEKISLSNPSHLTVNTHGDLLPFFNQQMTKSNSIVYCHFPLAKYWIDSERPEYFSLIHHASVMQKSKAYRTRFLAQAKSNYIQMIRNSTVLTNSEYSRRAIWKTFGIKSTVLSPPVEIERIRNAVRLRSSQIQKSETVLVISRFHYSKKIENAIKLARLLNENKIGDGLTIVGNLSSDSIEYFTHLREMVENYGLGRFVKFIINADFGVLTDLVCKSKVYFHPLAGEPFGISIVEAMSAGLIPVVPDIGGYTEFVPQKYQFHTLGEAVEAVAEAMQAAYSEKEKLSESVEQFSVYNYIQSFRKIVSELEERPRAAETETVPIPISGRRTHHHPSDLYQNSFSRIRS
ncbi:MAG TPA: glycosyltransferase family 4 protein [Candidatus Nitrosopolaris sp.]|nr:glycosyltransferase family 4 protein [Candidatus Nitrosopolaris sp.]